MTLNLAGTFTANPGDLASFFYNFNIALNSATPATFTLSVTATILNPPLPPQFNTLFTSTDPQTVPANSDQGYSGARQTAPAPFVATGNFLGSLTINFGAGTLAGDTMLLSIPNNSIDFQVAPTAAIPEPSTYALVAVGLCGLAWARRRRAART